MLVGEVASRPSEAIVWLFGPHYFICFDFKKYIITELSIYRYINDNNKINPIIILFWVLNNLINMNNGFIIMKINDQILHSRFGNLHKEFANEIKENTSNIINNTMFHKRNLIISLKFIINNYSNNLYIFVLRAKKSYCN